MVTINGNANANGNVHGGKAGFSQTFERLLMHEERKGTEFLWEIAGAACFNEAIISWNGERPERGNWTLYVSLHQLEWSPWLKYAEWTPSSQRTFKNSSSFAQTYQDAASPKSGVCDAIRVLLKAENGAALAHLDSLYICLSDLSEQNIHFPPSLPSIPPLNVPPRSQMLLDHPRRISLCSPTSTANAIQFLQGGKQLDPLLFAAKSHDDEFDIYGNWILNTAEAYCQLKGSYRVYASRLAGFEMLHAQLANKIPVIVSIRGQFPGASVYASGHLICITGYDAEKSRVFCIDPAYQTHETTRVDYSLKDFLEGWALRQNIAYIFKRVS